MVGFWSGLFMSVELTMKDLSQVLSQKEMDIERVRKEIKALHFVIPLLAEDADWIENGLASPVSAPQFRRSGTAGVKLRVSKVCRDCYHANTSMRIPFGMRRPAAAR